MSPREQVLSMVLFIFSFCTTKSDVFPRSCRKQRWLLPGQAVGVLLSKRISWKPCQSLALGTIILQHIASLSFLQRSKAMSGPLKEDPNFRMAGSMVNDLFPPP